MADWCCNRGHSQTPLSGQMHRRPKRLLCHHMVSCPYIFTRAAAPGRAWVCREQHQAAHTAHQTRTPTCLGLPLLWWCHGLVPPGNVYTPEKTKMTVKAGLCHNACHVCICIQGSGLGSQTVGLSAWLTCSDVPVPPWNQCWLRSKTTWLTCAAMQPTNMVSSRVRASVLLIRWSRRWWVMPGRGGTVAAASARVMAWMSNTPRCSIAEA